MTRAAVAVACRRVDRIRNEVLALAASRQWFEGFNSDPIELRAVGGEAPVIDHG